MQHASYRFSALLLLFSIPMGISYAADESVLVKAWLQKMVKAEHTVSYRGTFVYRHRDEMVVMKIVRARGEQGMFEQLSSLSGRAGDVVRNPDHVRCQLASSDISLLSGNGERMSEGEKVLHAGLGEIDRYYQLSLAEVSRVAGRMSQKIAIIPRDEFRYGYHLWIDQQSGLLLKSAHLSASGEVLEQMIYSEIEIFNNTLPVDLRQMLSDNVIDKTQASLSSKPVSDHDEANNWVVKYIPDGFKLVSYQRLLNAQQAAYEHIVFSDGLAAVSVFIEKMEESGAFNGVSQRGVMNAYLAAIDDYQVVVMGEVPLMTLELIGQSVHHSPVMVTH